MPMLLELPLPLAGIRRGRRKLQRYGFLLPSSRSVSSPD
jgi:hypothetical protein